MTVMRSRSCQYLALDSTGNFFSCFLFVFLLFFSLLNSPQIALAQVEIVEYGYDQGANGIGRLSSVVEKKGSATTGSTTYSYDARGNVTATDRVFPATPSDIHYLIQSTYDSLNRQKDLTYPDGEKIQNTYNNQGLLESVISTNRTTNGNYVSNFNYNALSQVTSKALGNGKTTTYDYYDSTAKGPTSFRLRNITTPGLQNLTYTYDNVGNVTGITDTIGSATQIFAYDSLHRLDSASSSASPIYTHFYQYNTIGNMTGIAEPGPIVDGDGSFRTEQVDVPSGDIAIAADGVSIVHLSYIPFRFFSSDPPAPLKYIRKVGDTWGAPEEIRGSENAWGGWGTSIALDGAGNPYIAYTVMVPKGDGTFDQGVRLAKRTSSGSWSVQPIADGVGAEPSIKVDSTGTVHVAYVGFGIKYARLTGGTWTVESVGTDFGSWPSLALSPSGTPRIAYMGQDLGSSAGPVRFASKNGGTWSVSEVPNSRPFPSRPSLAIDNAGVAHITFWTGNTTDSFLGELKYLKVGQAVQVLRTAQGSSVSIDVDDQGYPTIVYTGVFDTSLYPGPQSRVGYAHFNGTNWVYQNVDQTGGGHEAAVIALIEGHAHVGYNWTFGELKYARSFSTQTISYPGPGLARPHAPTGYLSSNYVYDLNGNRTNDNGGGVSRTYTWDFSNRLTRVQENGVTLADFTYDYTGRRTSKTKPISSQANQTIHYVGDLYECIPNTTTPCTKYIFAGGQRIASRPVGSNDVHYYYKDHLASTSVVADSAGTALQTVYYFPFGKTRFNSLGSSSGERYKFTDKELDEETNIYYYGARYYDPGLIHFISADTMGGDLDNPQTLNRYSYVLNNPLRYTDPTGNVPMEYQSGFSVSTTPDESYSGGSGLAGLEEANRILHGTFAASPTGPRYDLSSMVGLRFNQSFFDTSGDEISAPSWYADPIEHLVFLATWGMSAAPRLGVNVAEQAVGFAPGLARSALAPSRLQHASRHLIEVGMSPRWNKVTAERFIEIAESILEKPLKTFDYKLGRDAVRGFVGKVNGQDIVIFIYKEGPLQGKIATSFVPSAEQAVRWGLR